MLKHCAAHRGEEVFDQQGQEIGYHRLAFPLLLCCPVLFMGESSVAFSKNLPSP
jgi:hypothetical protein